MCKMMSALDLCFLALAMRWPKTTGLNESSRDGINVYSFSALVGKHVAECSAGFRTTAGVYLPSRHRELRAARRLRGRASFSDLATTDNSLHRYVTPLPVGSRFQNERLVVLVNLLIQPGSDFSPLHGYSDVPLNYHRLK
jgi:hypothetical protein